MRLADRVESPVLRLDDSSEKFWKHYYIFVKKDTMGLEDTSYLLSEWRVDKDFGDLPPSTEGATRIQRISEFPLRERIFPRCLPFRFHKGVRGEPVEISEEEEESEEEIEESIKGEGSVSDRGKLASFLPNRLLQTLKHIFHKVVFPNVADMSFKALLNKRLKNNQEAASGATTLPPLPKKKKTEHTSSPASRTRARLQGSVTVDIPDDDDEIVGSSLEKLLLPKFEKKEKEIPLTESIEALPKEIFKLLQVSLSMVKKRSKDVLEKEEAMRKVQEENAQLKEKNQSLRVELLDVKASKDGAEREIRRLTKAVEENSAYYGWKARLELMEEYNKGEASKWNYGEEKQAFEKEFKFFIPEENPDADEAMGESNAPEKDQTPAPVVEGEDVVEDDEKTATE